MSSASQLAIEIFETTSTAARVIGCNEVTVRRLAATGQLPVIRTAVGSRLFRRADVERVAADRREARSRRESEPHA